MSLDFTVAIRTFNGAKRLPEVLERLQHQINPDGIRWEVVVVDNNSGDDTAAVVAEHARQWRDVQLRYILETRAGSSYARDRAMQEAASDLVGFLDDDNLPADDWVIEAYRFGNDNPSVGAYGSNIYAMLDTPPPPDFGQIQYLLTVADRGPTPFRYLKTKPRLVPAGAGCVIRKQAWQDCVPAHRRLRGRDETWKVMIGGAEDTEVMYFIHNSHWELWHNPAMKIWHHLSPRRLERDYLLKISHASGLSVHALWLSQVGRWQRPFVPILTGMYVTIRAYRLALYYLKHRQEFDRDRAKACQFQFMLGRLLSPFVTPRPTCVDNSHQPSTRSNPLVYPSSKEIA